MHLLSSVSLAIVACCGTVLALDNGLARTPQMGWNSWNHFNCKISESLIRATADAMVNTGLSKVGYKYINLDDCWQIKRDDQGVIVADPEAFPSGIKALADYVHNLGLQFGLYSDAGNYTCQGRPGGYGHEIQDAKTYAEWGVDYLKYDNCFNDAIDPKIRYPRMRDALKAAGRPILYSLCEWGSEDPATWAPQVGNSWRTTNDIANSWDSVMSNIDQNDNWWKYAGPGGWNDPDMLQVGNGVLNADEGRAHFSLWAITKAPLLIGNDLTNIDSVTLEILSNTEVIAVNQDPLGIQGHKVLTPGFGEEVWAGPMSDGSVVVVMLNRNTAQTTISFKLSDVGLSLVPEVRVRDLWAHSDIGIVSDQYSAPVGAHAAVMLRLYPTAPGATSSNDDVNADAAFSLQ